MNESLRLKRNRTPREKAAKLNRLELRGSVLHFAGRMRDERIGLKGLEDVREKRDYLGIPESPTHISARALHRQFERLYRKKSKFLIFISEFKYVTGLNADKRVNYIRRTKTGTITTSKSIMMFSTSELYRDP